MPPLAAWLVRTSLLHLAAGVSIGALLLAAKADALPPALWRLLPAHVELLLVGWPAPLAMGVAYWILPRVSGGRVRRTAAALAFALLVTGVWLVVLASAPGAPPTLRVAGRLAEAAAAAAFALHAWPRVRAAFPPR